MDAIRLLMMGRATGKGFNIKGKSAKLNLMAGLVPYVQRSKEAHETLAEPSGPADRATVYYSTDGRSAKPWQRTWNRVGQSLACQGTHHGEDPRPPRHP